MYKETSFPFTESALNLDVDIKELAQDGLRVAVAKRGELAEKSFDYMINQFGLNEFLPQSSRALWRDIRPNVKLFQLRALEIIEGLRNNALDMAILGPDIILEEQLNANPTPLVPIEFLGFGGCEFRIAFPWIKNIPKGGEIQNFLQSGRIATTLPNTLQYILRQDGINLKSSQIITFSGSTEASWMLYPDVIAVADRVSSGETMLANGLRADLALIQFPGAYLATTENFLERTFGRAWQLSVRPPRSNYFILE